MQLIVGSFTTLQRSTHRARVHTPKGNRVPLPVKGKTRAQAVKAGNSWLAQQSNPAEAVLALFNKKRANSPHPLPPLTLDEL